MFWFCWCYPQLEIGCQALHHPFHVTPIRPKFVLAVLWLHHNCCSYKLYRLARKQPAETTLGPASVLVFRPLYWMSPRERSYLRASDWSVATSLIPFAVRLWWNHLLKHSSVGLSLNINTAGSFRKITFSCQDWTMVNMSYHQFSLKYPHSSSRQSRRRANKRKRVSGDSWQLVSPCFSVFPGTIGYLTHSWSGLGDWTDKKKACFWQLSQCHF